MRAVKKHGYSRIPVFNTNVTHLYGVILVKDMLDIDLDGEPQHIFDFGFHHAETIGSRTALDTTLGMFLSSRTHMMAIEKGSEIIGVLTLEDLLEEIVGHEITDETDRD